MHATTSSPATTEYRRKLEEEVTAEEGAPAKGEGEGEGLSDMAMSKRSAQLLHAW